MNISPHRGLQTSHPSRIWQETHGAGSAGPRGLGGAVPLPARAIPPHGPHPGFTTSPRTPDKDLGCRHRSSSLLLLPISP